MNIYLNDAEYEIADTATLHDVLLPWITSGTVFAAALNHVFVPKDQYLNTSVSTNDQVHVLTPMQGG